MASELSRIKQAMADGEHTDGDLATAVELWEAAELALMSIPKSLEEAANLKDERDSLLLKLDTAEQERDEAREAQRGNYAAAELLRSERDAALLRVGDGSKRMLELVEKHHEVIAERDSALLRLDSADQAVKLSKVAYRMAEERANAAERERDLAIAHDLQPYPTVEAYEKACAALHAREDEVKTFAELLHSYVEWFDRPAREHGWITPSDDWLRRAREMVVETSLPFEQRVEMSAGFSRGDPDRVVRIDNLDACDGCYECLKGKREPISGMLLTGTRMILCPTCGNKRCPKATNHRNLCSNSNQTGQPGSRFR